jgi:hypothetical protein
MTRKTKKEDDVPGMADGANYGLVRFYPQAVMDDVKWTKFVKFAERLVRSCVEQKDYVQYLRDELRLDRDIFMGGVSVKDASIEIHHAPLTLFDIVFAVARNVARTGNLPFSTFSVANEVVRLHYAGKVGVVPLCKTVHELVHAGKVSVPISAIHGDVRWFVKEYSLDIDKEALKKLESVCTRDAAAQRRSNSSMLSADVRVWSRGQLERFSQELRQLVAAAETPEEDDIN